jgi:hypothetical protein
MNLSAPTMGLFVISIVIAIIAALATLGVIAFIPLASVWIMAVAFVVLATGCLFKGA